MRVGKCSDGPGGSSRHPRGIQRVAVRFPGFDSPGSAARTQGYLLQQIFIGDVQGCADELDALLARARQRFRDDFELWLVGDLVNRGPASMRVLERARELDTRGRLRCVLGNHDLALIQVAWGLRELRPTDTFAQILTRKDLDDWIEWLRRLPLVVTGRLGAQEFAMVHAAANPDWDLTALRRAASRAEARLRSDLAPAFLASAPNADPDRDTLARLTSCRSIDPSGAWSPEPPQGRFEAWHRRWKAKEHDYGVVYGHWSLQGLHVENLLRGIDTGCVHDGRGRSGFLTAWIPDLSRRKPFDVPDEGFWQERARRPYYRELAER